MILYKDLHLWYASKDECAGYFAGDFNANVLNYTDNTLNWNKYVTDK